MKKIIFILLCLFMVGGCFKSEKTNINSNVTYEIFVGSFYDSNGDGIGDLQGIIHSLGYLEDLGVGRIWLTPINTSDSYHKYDVIDYKDIDKSFGTLDDFDDLIKEANKRNIKVIFDLVLNHTSSKHPWFLKAIKDKNSKTYNYYNFKDDKNFEFVFGPHMPDLNLDNNDVRNEIKDIVSFWLDKGVAGFRLDAPFHYYGIADKNNEFLSWLNKTIKDINKDAFIVGEVWSDNSTVLAHYKSGVESFFDFSLSSVDGKIVKSIRSKDGKGLANYIFNNNNKIHSENINAVNSIFLSNHDQGRSGGFFSGNLNQSKLMANVLLLSPGIPYIYYGEEIGMLGSGIDENKRLAMLWGEKGECDNPKNSNYNINLDTSVKKQKKDKNSMLNHYKKVISLRNKYSLWINSDLEVLDLKDSSIYALKQTDKKESIIVIHNFSFDEKIIKLDEKIIDVIFIEDSSYKNNEIKLKPLSSLIVEIER